VSQDASEYIERLSSRLRAGPELPPDWRDLVDEGLVNVYAGRDHLALAKMVRLIVSQLDARNKHEEALAELEYVAANVAADHDASTMVMAIKAGVLLNRNRVAEAADLATEVTRRIPTLVSPDARATSASTTLIVRLNLFDESSGPEAQEWMRTEQDVPQRLFAATWFIPWLFARGEFLAAKPWTRDLRLNAKDHVWRRSDAAVFDLAGRVAGDLTSEPDTQLMPANLLARCREVRLRLYALTRTERWAEVEPYLAQSSHLVRELSVNAVGPAQNFIAVVEAFRDGAISTTPVKANGIHLASLPSVLAGAEAIAYAGTQADAAEWLAYWDAVVRPAVRSSLEWPVAARRIHALLALRAGHQRRARGGFQEAISWAQREEAPVELALARLQLAEMDEASGRKRESLAGTRREAWAVLRQFGVPPANHTYAVGRALGMQPGQPPAGKLSGREAEVLVGLSEGLKYREIAERHTLSPRTVQTLVHRIYEKLGVSGKVPAIAEARRRGIL
jgi:DNA-binding CsgD family transcriptional regulator